MIISYKEYQDMSVRIMQFQMERGRKPKYVTLNGSKIGQRQYEDMMRRVDLFIKSKGRNPKSVRLDEDMEIIKPSLGRKKSASWIKLEEALDKKFNDAKDLYKAIADHGEYKYYYNDKFDNKMALTRLRKGLGINCTDYSQLLRPVLEDMGYDVRYAHGRVKCGDKQWYGHVWLQIKGRDYGNWVNYDVVAVTHHGIKRPIGSLVCVNGVKDVEYNPKWLF